MITTSGIGNVTLPKQVLKVNLSQQIKTNTPVPANSSSLSTLVVPGFNDHHVILFGKKPSETKKGAQYQPIDQVEKNSMNIYNNVAPSVVQLKVAGEKKVVNPMTGEEETVVTGGSGSGSIIDKNGHVMTNFHVIAGGDNITVVLDKDKEVKGTLIGSDPSTDIAIVKLDMPKSELEKLPVMKIGTSETVEGGQRVFAIGNPFGLYRSTSQGIVSALGRSIISPGGRLTKGVIQTDAAMNPGNSGGALVNAVGEQIGVNSQIASPSGGSVGIGFSIPIDTAVKIAADLKTIGRVIRPYLGLSGGIPLEAIPAPLKKILNINEIKEGVLLQSIIPGGPADESGLKGGEFMVQFGPQQAMLLGGDIITKVNGKPVSNMTEIFEILDEHKIGSDIEIEYINLDLDIKPPNKIAGLPSEPKVMKLVVGETPNPKATKDLNLGHDLPKRLEDEDLRDFRFRS